MLLAPIKKLRVSVADFGGMEIPDLDADKLGNPPADLPDQGSLIERRHSRWQAAGVQQVCRQPGLQGLTLGSGQLGTLHLGLQVRG